MTNKNEFEGFDGSGFGTDVPQDEKWQYIGIGYHITNGVFFVDSDKQSKLTLVPFAIRQCKEVVDHSGMIHRYPVKYARTKMVQGTGKITYRVQVVCTLEGDEDNIYIFGSRKYVTNMLWVNKRSGNFHKPEFRIGLWYAQLDKIKETEDKRKIETAPYCWNVKLSPETSTITVGQGGDTSSVTPIAYEGNFDFVGAKQAHANRALYKSEDLKGWVKQWQNPSTEADTGEDGSIGAVADALDTIPGFDLD